MFRAIPVLFVWLLLMSCNKEEKVEVPYRPTDAYDSYVHGLRTTNLIHTALGTDWLNASSEAIRTPVLVPIPYTERFHIDPRKPNALGLRFEAKRGQKVTVDLDPGALDSVFVFVDLFRIESDSLMQVRHVATADSVQSMLEFEPRTDAEYVVRVIPELLRGGDFTISIRNKSTLAFPVAGKDRWAIQSKFGDPRDGGKRDHHGVDIFARRHTPILAPIRAQVRSVNVQKLGGNVIWLRDTRRGTNLYFAHLQEQLVSEGEWVEPGDTIGTVGNTGNAKSTPPHLHFGIYRRGPVDPYHFIVSPDTVPDKIEAPVEMVGFWAEVRQRVSIRSTYGSEFDIYRDLEPGSFVRIVAATGKFFRTIVSPGVHGYVLASSLEALPYPISDSTPLDSLITQ